ncbi:LysR family transcriptional regulator [Rhizobium sp. LjRoot254]|uniref:LysR family transcriptional regulator n=1 Tax=Rhizobium sp. LjRoot254 TaxID=3342297 RepID=UPI003ECFC206
MNAAFLLTFLDLLESRNFKRTADRLAIAQSAVSARIQALEKEFGARLFERGRSGAVPTAAGLRFEPYCRSLLATFDQARQDVGVPENFTGTLRITAQFSLMRSVLIAWTTELRRSQREIALRVETDYSLQINRDLAMGSIDIGLLFRPQFLPEFHIEQVGNQEFVMVSTDAGQLSAVDQRTYIRAAYTSQFERLHQEQLPQFASAAIAVGYEELAVGLMEQFGGSSYVPRQLAAGLVEGRGARFTLVEDAPILMQPIYSAVHSRRRHSVTIMGGLRALALVLDRTGHATPRERHADQAPSGVESS